MQGTFTKRQRVAEGFVKARLIRPEFFPAMSIGGLKPINEAGSNLSHKYIAEASYFCYRVFLSYFRHLLNISSGLREEIDPYVNNSACPTCIATDPLLKDFLKNESKMKGDYTFGTGETASGFQDVLKLLLDELQMDNESGFIAGETFDLNVSSASQMLDTDENLNSLKIPVFVLFKNARREAVWISIVDLVKLSFDDDIYSDTPDGIEKIIERYHGSGEPTANGLRQNQMSRFIVRNILVAYMEEIKTKTLSSTSPMGETYLVFVNLLAMIRNMFFFIDSAQLSVYMKFKEIFGIDKPDFSDESPLPDLGKNYQWQSQYANLVKGNLTNSSMTVVWQPTVGGGIDTIDQEQFATVMWSGIDKFVTKYVETHMRDLSKDTNTAERTGRRLAERIAMVRRQMKDIWYRTFKYSVSSEVNAIEHDIIQRAEREMGNRGWDSNQIQIFIKDFLRIDKRYNHVFAAAVGKRLLTQRLISRGRTSIMEHHRSVNWAESAYQMYRNIHGDVRRIYNDNPLPEVGGEVDYSFGKYVRVKDKDEKDIEVIYFELPTGRGRYIDFGGREEDATDSESDSEYHTPPRVPDSDLPGERPPRRTDWRSCTVSKHFNPHTMEGGIITTGGGGIFPDLDEEDQSMSDGGSEDGSQSKEELLSKIELLTSSNTEYERALQLKDGVIERMNQTLEEWLQDFEKKNRRIKELEEKVNAGSMPKCEDKGANVALDECKGIIEYLQRTIKRLEQDIQREKEMYETMKRMDETEYYSRVDSINIIHKNELGKLQNKLKECQDENNQVKNVLEGEIKTLNEEISFLRDREETFELKIDDLQDQLKDVTNSFNVSKDSFQEKIKQMKKEHESTTQNLQDQIDEKQKENVSLSEELNQCMIEKGGAKKNNEELKKEFEKRNEDVKNAYKKSLEEKLRRVQEENTKKREELEVECKEEVSQLEREKEELKSKLRREYNEKIDELNGLITMNIHEKTILESENNQMRQKLDEMEGKYVKSLEENNELLKSFDKKSRDFELFREQYNEQMTKYKKECDEEKKNIEESNQKRVESLNRTIQEKRDEVLIQFTKALNGENEVSRLEMEKKELEIGVKQLEDEIAQITTEHEHLKNLHITVNGKLKVYKAKAGKYKSKSNELKDKLATYEESKEIPIYIANPVKPLPSGVLGTVIRIIYDDDSNGYVYMIILHHETAGFQLVQIHKRSEEYILLSALQIIHK